MIIKRNIEEDESGKLIECIINSSNILKTVYFVHNKNLYVYFKRGHVYSYQNIPEDIYLDFEKSDSQGEFFLKEIAANFSYQKLFKLTDSEITETKNLIEEWKENNPQ